MSNGTHTAMATTMAARVAGEDIAGGDYVTVMNEIIELPSFLWCCSDASLAPDELVRLRCTARNAGQPYKVIGVCLPFVYGKTPRGRITVIDTRQQQIVRLDKDCANAVWAKMKSSSKKTRN